LSGRNRRIGTDLIADVLDQSADELIDGVTSAQENSYTISHYFGDAERRDGMFYQSIIKLHITNTKRKIIFRKILVNFGTLTFVFHLR
jgi:hypothetical protein